MLTERSARTGSVAPGWFSVGVQALVYLDHASNTTCSSAEIAEQMQAHAVFLRRVMAPLVRAGIVEAREGRDGGYLLARPAERITLADIYQAMREASADDGESTETTRGPTVPAGLRIAMDEIMFEVDEQILQTLAGYTVADVAARSSVAHEDQGYH